jgi:hypothetical protein
VPCATRCSRCGVRWKRHDRNRARIRWPRHRRRPPRRGWIRSPPSNLDRNRSDRISQGLSQDLSRRPSLRQCRRPHVSRLGLRSPLRARRRHPRHHRCHLARPDRPPLRVRPTRSLVRQPRLPRRAPAASRPRCPPLRPLPLAQRRPRPPHPQAQVLLRSQEAPSHRVLRLRRRLQRDLRGRPGFARRTPSSLRIRRSRQSGWLERSSPTWSCTILASARKGFATGT